MGEEAGVIEVPGTTQYRSGQITECLHGTDRESVEPGESVAGRGIAEELRAQIKAGPVRLKGFQDVVVSQQRSSNLVVG